MGTQGNKSSCGKFKEKALVIDSFGTHFTFMLPNGQKKYRSLIGSILTVLTVVGVAMYGIYKLELLFSRADSQVSLIVEEGYFENHNSTFTQANGFNIAVGIY